VIIQRRNYHLHTNSPRLIARSTACAKRDYFWSFQRMTVTVSKNYYGTWVKFNQD